MGKRQQISKKLRFTILERDGFKCVYCGAEAKDTKLHIDHVKPVSKGGTNDIFNLVTSCKDCNLGKFNRELNDNTEISFQKLVIDQMMDDHLETKKYLERKLELQNKRKKDLEFIYEYIDIFYSGISFSDYGKRNIEKYYDKYGSQDLLDEFDCQRSKYAFLKLDKREMFEKVITSTFKMLDASTLPEWKQKIAYIIGICKNKFGRIGTKRLAEMLDHYYKLDYSLDQLTKHLKDNEFKNITQFKEYINSFIHEQ